MVDDLRGLPIVAGLHDEQLRQLAAAGEEVHVSPGQELFRHGEYADAWWVLIDGTIDLVRRTDREETVVGRMDEPGRWAGGFRAFDPQGVYLATGRVATAGRVLRVPAGRLRSLCDAWFPLGTHLIQGVFGTARTIESTVRQRDALVTLGTLAAGLAHEINNPAAAAVRATQSLQAVCATLLSALNRLAGAEISASQFLQLDELRREVVPPPGPVDPLDLSDRQEDLSSWMAARGVDRGWAFAPALAAAGADTAWCDRVGDVLGAGGLGDGAHGGAALAPAFEWFASTFDAPRLLTEIGESTRRISELVSAVRTYSHLDQASMQNVDVTQGLESTLVMLRHKMPARVRVERRYGADVPTVDAHAGELNQVWTNLIDNAVDAMNGAGTLRLTTSHDDDTSAGGGAVIVEIGDDGPGMPPEVAARAFEAFFTTKDVGKGTGLGLDIARRIVVERHCGTITIESKPGDTMIRVRLPLRQPSAS
ncbi:ATP-binding protein [Frankia sp. R43]|nr:ATP-binding protein [Frankia sp. R43]